MDGPYVVPLGRDDYLSLRVNQARSPPCPHHGQSLAEGESCQDAVREDEGRLSVCRQVEGCAGVRLSAVEESAGEAFAQQGAVCVHVGPACAVAVDEAVGHASCAVSLPHEGQPFAEVRGVVPAGCDGHVSVGVDVAILATTRVDQGPSTAGSHA